MSSHICPKCGSSRNLVIDSRKSRIFEQPTTRRRRRCTECLNKWTTYELSEELVLRLERLDNAVKTLNN